MKRLESVLIISGFFILVGTALFWFGGLYKDYLQPHSSLWVAAPPLQRLDLGAPAVFELSGQGLERDTVASLVMDVSNDDMIISRFPLEGNVNASLIVGDLLFLGNNDGLKVVDIADPQSPQLLGKYLSGRSVLNLHYNADYLFVVCGRLGIVVMSIAGDTLVHQTDIWVNELVTECLYHQGFLYVAAQASGLLIFDMRESQQGAQVGRVSYPMPIRSLVIADSHLYVSIRSDEIFVFDGADPINLRALGSITLPAQVRKLLIVDGALYAALPDSLWQLSLDQPAHPSPVRSWGGFNALVNLIPGVDCFYALDNYLAFRTIDTVDHQISDHVQFAAGLRTLAEGFDHLYITGAEEGLLTIAKDRIQARQVARDVSIPVGGIRDALIVDDVIFVAGVSGLFAIRNTQDEQASRRLDSNRNLALVQHRNYLFALQNTHQISYQETVSVPVVVRDVSLGVKVFDISNPKSPEAIDQWPYFTGSLLAVANHYLLVAGIRTGLTVIDISDLERHPVVDSLSEIHIVAMVAEKETLYLLTRDHGLQIYVVGHDGKLDLVSQVSRPFPMNQFDEQVGIQVRDGVVYIANGRSGLLIMDAQNPRHPRLLSSLDLPGYSRGVHLYQHQVYVISLRDGISIVDISVPGSPKLTGHLPIGRITRYLLFNDDLLYYFQDQKGMTAIPVPLKADTLSVKGNSQLKIVLPSPVHSGRYSLQIGNRNGLVVHNGVVEYQ